MQHLEAIEQKALSYLGQVSNPLVRIDVLHAHLTDADADEQIPCRDLEDFLKHHELFRVIEALPQETDGATEDLTGHDASASYVILSSRVPTQKQTAAMMLEQLNSMHESLSVAQAEARNNADFPLLGKVGVALHRIEALRGQLIATAKSSNSSS